MSKEDLIHALENKKDGVMLGGICPGQRGIFFYVLGYDSRVDKDNGLV